MTESASARPVLINPPLYKQAMQRDVNCFGGPTPWFPVSTVSLQWITENSSVATVDSFGTVTAQDQQGSTGVYADWTAYTYQWNPNNEVCDTYSGEVGYEAYFQTDPPIPHHVRVYSDVGGFPQSCFFTGVYRRDVSVQIVNQFNRLVGSGSVQEGFTNLTTNTCGIGSPIPSPCHLVDVIGLGLYTDSMAVSGNSCGSGISQGSGCGYTLTSTWRMCGSQTMNIWTYNGETRSNIVRVNGNS